jgi:hypothetical protein
MKNSYPLPGSPPAAPTTAHQKQKAWAEIYIYRNFTQPSKIGFYLATIKKEKGPGAPQQEKILSLSLLCASIFLSCYFFLVQHTCGAGSSSFLWCARHHNVTVVITEAMRRRMKRLL